MSAEPDPSTADASSVARACLQAGIDAAHPSTVIDDAIRRTGNALSIDGATYDLDEYEDVLVVGGGNAAGFVAVALESILGEEIMNGAVATDVPTDTDHVDVLPGSHPLPSREGVESTERILSVANGATADDLVVVIVTGGGSAIMAAPTADVSVSDLQAVTADLLQSGAEIDEINAVRKHLSDVKGGQLARLAAPAKVVGVAFSDVVDNDLGVVASGPTGPDNATYHEARTVLESYDIDPPESVQRVLDRGIEGDLPETPGADDPVFDSVDNHVLVDGLDPLEAAAVEAQDKGYDPLILSARIRGEASEVAKAHVGIAEEVLASGNPIEPPAAILSGGETTVTVDGDGTGGPNLEFALSAGVELDRSGVVIASIDTDGSDGLTDVAGAIVEAGTVTDSTAATEALDDNASYPFLKRRNALLKTGDTGTNVNDLRVLVLEDK